MKNYGTTFTTKEYEDLKRWFENLNEDDACDLDKANRYFLLKKFVEYRNGKEED